MRRQIPWNTKRAARRSGLFRLLADSQAGFTIIEVVVSAVLVASIAGATASALISTSSFSGDQRRRSQADEIAQQDQERLRGMSIKSLTSLPTMPRPVGPFEGTTYDVTSTGQFISNTGTSSCSTSGSGAAAYVLIRSSVTWSSNRRTPVVQESLITPAAGGTLLTNVVDENNAPLAGATITIYGKETEDATTGTGGCAIFGGLTTSGYYVFAEKSGYVDPNGNDNPVGGATVTASGTSFPTPNPFKLGLAGAIQASFTASNGTLTGQHAPSLSVSHAERTNPVITTPPSPATPITTPTTLFPFPTAYTVWAGKCPGQQPPTGANRIAIMVGPGQLATTPAVKEPAMNVRVYYPSYNPATPTVNRIKPDAMKLTYATTAGSPACTETWSPAIRSDAATNANGSLVSPGQPFAGTTTVGSTTWNGAYTVCADYDPPPAGAGGGDRRWGLVASQANTDFTAATLVPVTIPSSGSSGTTGTGACP